MSDVVVVTAPEPVVEMVEEAPTVVEVVVEPNTDIDHEHRITQLEAVVIVLESTMMTLTSEVQGLAMGQRELATDVETVAELAIEAIETPEPEEIKEVTEPESPKEDEPPSSKKHKWWGK